MPNNCNQQSFNAKQSGNVPIIIKNLLKKSFDGW